MSTSRKLSTDEVDALMEGLQLLGHHSQSMDAEALLNFSNYLEALMSWTTPSKGD